MASLSNVDSGGVCAAGAGTGGMLRLSVAKRPRVGRPSPAVSPGVLFACAVRLPRSDPFPAGLPGAGTPLGAWLLLRASSAAVLAGACESLESESQYPLGYRYSVLRWGVARDPLDRWTSNRRKAGKVAEEKARDKNRDHPVFDPQTHRRMHAFDFCALSFERHGFWAKETVGFVKKLATSRAVALGLEPSEEIKRWHAAISCCIQRSNAKILRGEPVPGNSTPPPSRFAAMGRDLGMAWVAVREI